MEPYTSMLFVYIFAHLLVAEPKLSVPLADGVTFPTPVMSPLTLALPSKLLPHNVLAVFSFVAVDALPLNVAVMVDGNKRYSVAEPSTLTAAPVWADEASRIYMLRAVPHFAVVMSAVPLNEVPLMLRAFNSFVAVVALL